MKTSDIIYLIDMSDEIAWCDCIPSDDISEEDTVEYIRMDIHKALMHAKDVECESLIEAIQTEGY